MMGAPLLLTVLFITIEMITLGSCGVITSEAGSAILATNSTPVTPMKDAHIRTVTVPASSTVKTPVATNGKSIVFVIVVLQTIFYSTHLKQ